MKKLAFFPSQIAVNRCFPKLSKARKHPQLFPPKIKTAYLNKRRNTININAWCGCPSPAAHRSRVSPACERGVCCLLQPCTLVHAHTCLLVVVNSWPHLSLLMAAQPNKPWIFLEMHLLFYSCSVTSVLGIQKYQTGELYFLQEHKQMHLGIQYLH